jgi:hypothetical protein
MNRMTRKMILGAGVFSAALLSDPVVARAAEGREGLGERIERIERRLDQMGAQQEQLLHQTRAQAERLEQRFNQMAERREQFLRQDGTQGGRVGPKLQGPAPHLRPPLGQPPANRPLMPPEGAPLSARPLKGLHDALGLVVLVWIVCNILMAIWIFGDIRKRGEGSALFGVMALFAGIPAAVIYALVRIGDRLAARSSPTAGTGTGGATGGVSLAPTPGSPS